MTRLLDRLAGPSGGVRRYSMLNYAAMAFGFISGPMTVRALGASGRGTIAEVGAYSAVFGIVFTMGVEGAITHEAALHPERRAALFRSAIVVALGITPFVLLADAGLVLGPFQQLTQTERVLAAAVILLTPLGVFCNFLQSFLVASGELRSLSWIRTLPLWTTGAVVVVLFCVGRLTVVNYLIGTIIALVVQMAYGTRKVHLRPSVGQKLAPLLGFGLRGSIGLMMSYVNVTLDQALIGPFVGTRALGYYAVAVTIASLPSTVVFALAFRSFSQVVRAGRDVDSAAGMAMRSKKAVEQVRFAAALVTLLTVLLIAASPVVLPLLYGSGFARRALPPLLLLGPGIIAMAVWGMAVQALIALKRPGLATLVQIPGLVATAIGLPLSLPRWGIEGAAVTTTVSFAFVAVSSVLALSYLGGGPIFPSSSDRRAIQLRLRSLRRGRYGRVHDTLAAGGRHG